MNRKIIMPKRKNDDSHHQEYGKMFRVALQSPKKVEVSKPAPTANPKLPVTVYNGKSAADAGVVIDSSQGEFGLNSSIPGHARAHVSRGSKGVEAREMYCVENFSLASDEAKTGFFLRSDQNKFVHKALTSKQGQEKLKCLNLPGKFEVHLCSSMTEFEFCAGRWEKGELKETFKPEKGVVVLQHKRKYHDPCKPPPATQSVHVFTAYPIKPKKTGPPKYGGGGLKPDRPGCPPGCDEGRISWYACRCDEKRASNGGKSS